jgi:hypothetical protein
MNRIVAVAAANSHEAAPDPWLVVPNNAVALLSRMAAASCSVIRGSVM